MGGSTQKKSQNNKRTRKKDKWVEKAEMAALVAGNCAQQT